MDLNQQPFFTAGAHNQQIYHGGGTVIHPLMNGDNGDQ
jgi:hypothetical protein